MRISLLTAVHPPRATHLAETAASVVSAAATLAAAGHQLEWVVAVDGPGGVAAVDGPGGVPDLAATPEVRVLNRPVNGGVSAARNTALAHATGELVMPLDHDDLVDAAGLAALLADPRAHEEVWAAGHPRLLDGSWTAHRVLEARRWAPRQLEENWTSPFPFHPNVVVARREVALASGGWPALSGNQDLGYAFALNRRHAGWALPYPLILYRLWADQTVSQDYYPALKALDFEFLTVHLNAERAAAGLPPIVAPMPGGSRVAGPAGPAGSRRA